MGEAGGSRRQERREEDNPARHWMNFCGPCDGPLMMDLSATIHGRTAR
jgi:hypothetical protein